MLAQLQHVYKYWASDAIVEGKIQFCSPLRQCSRSDAFCSSLFSVFETKWQASEIH